MFDLEYQLKMLPQKPGVYIMKNSVGTVIYVGKAKVLKNRVKQYFQKSKNHSEKVKHMVQNISEFEYVVTDSEIEALILECNLIKKYRPKYNILLKDDKMYPFIKITLNEDFPRVFMTRNVVNDGSKYFGPYPDYFAVKEVILLIRQLFPLRTCKRNIIESKVNNSKPIRPCLNYDIGLCKAPCCGNISKKEYRDIVDGVVELLKGKNKYIKKSLEAEMNDASEKLEFEKAAEIRDKILAIDKILEKQKMYFGSFKNEDYINIYSSETDSCVQIFFMRNGKIVGREHFIYNDTSGYKNSEILYNFVKQFYGGTAFIPHNIIVPELKEVELFEAWFEAKKGEKVNIIIPQRGERKKLLNMIEQNAKITLERFKSKYILEEQKNKNVLENLSKILKIDNVPCRIEAYDISNIQGVDSVGSMVVFEDGKPKHSDYRRFKINTVKGPNDYESMKEILERRFTHAFEEIKQIKNKHIQLSKGRFATFPDLILVDGGIGQVNQAIRVLDKFDLNIPVCGMVKDDKHKTRGLIYNNNEIEIKMHPDIMNLITRIQDEAHRFAITYHRTLRDKRLFYSALDDIPGVGAKRKRELMEKFGGIENIKNATIEELIKVPSINVKVAKNIKEYLK